MGRLFGERAGAFELGRRRFLQSAAQLGAAAGLPLLLPACASQQTSVTPTAKSGTLRLGLAGGSWKDSFNPKTYTDSVAMVLGYQVMNGLIEIDENRQPIPELFESWDVKPGAREWSFALRKDVVFHNGKTLSVDDVLYSINLHRIGSQSPIAGALENIEDLRADGPGRVNITLARGDADFLYVLSDYHILVVPDGFGDWDKPIGTGAFKFEMYQPGTRAVTLRQGNYWKQGRAHVDAVDLLVINDENERIEALLTDRVDVINRVNRFRAPQIESSSTAKLVRAPSGWHCDFAMNVARAPFDNSNLRLALKYAIDRDLLLKRLWNGFGRIGNDHPITVADPFYNSELTQISRDVDKAKFYLNKSGLSNPEIVLSASNAAYEGAEEVSELFMQSANQTGINIKIRHTSAHTFWDDTWMKAPFFTSYWGGRPAATQMLAVAYASDAGWNETNWRRSKFDELLRLAREELDVSKRRTCIWDMQAMIQQDGGAVIPTFADWLDAHSARVQGHTPHTHFDLCNARIAEKVSLIS